MSLSVDAVLQAWRALRPRSIAAPSGMIATA
jgi:hypothetical protein